MRKARPQWPGQFRVLLAADVAGLQSMRKRTCVLELSHGARRSIKCTAEAVSVGTLPGSRRTVPFACGSHIHMRSTEVSVMATQLLERNVEERAHP